MTRQRSRRPRKSAFRLVALLPFTIFGLVFAAYPVVQVIRMSFLDVRIVNGQFLGEPVGLDNWIQALTSGASWQAIWNTVAFVALTTIFTLALGLALALLVDRLVVLLPIARNMLIWPAVVAPVVVSLMWLLILSPTAGGLNKLLLSLGLPPQGLLGNSPGAFFSIVVVDVWHWTPVVFLFLYTALQTIEPSAIEAARIDGAHEGQIIRFVVVPLLRPAIAAVIVVRVIMGVKAFDEMYLLTSGGPNGATTLVSQQIKTLFFDSMHFGEASAFSLFIVILTAALLGIVLFIRSRKEKVA
jgi:multiple sugar transport system permease protein